MPASTRPSPSGPSRPPVRSGAAIAHRQENYQKGLVKRIRIAGGLAVLQALIAGLYLLFVKGADLQIWVVGGVAVVTLAAAIGIFFKFRIAGIVVVAISVLDLAGIVWARNWTALLLPVVFLLFYVDGMRALFAWSRMRAVAPAPELDVEALG